MSQHGAYIEEVRQLLQQNKIECREEEIDQEPTHIVADNDNINDDNQPIAQAKIWLYNRL